MVFLQRITPGRRSYNQFVADETMEDYALRFTAISARKFSAGKIGNTALGATSFLALEAIGGAVTLQAGTVNAVAAILAVGLLIAITAGPIAYAAARAGVDIDLLTRAAGFGYIGSTVTSLIYASFTFIFFAIEASIFADMLNLTCGIPLWLGYVLSAAAIIPLVAYGITFISRLQAWTQPLWVVLNFLPIAVLACHPALLSHWRHYTGVLHTPGFSLLPFGICASVIVSLIAQVGEQVDYLRFLKPAAEVGWLRWWSALILSGPGWIIPGMVKMLAGSALAVIALQAGILLPDATRPGIMYIVAYGLFLPAHLAILPAALLVAVAQTKINVTNAYAGSIAWSNFFSRLTHRHPGRVVWLVFNVAIGLLLMELGIYRSIQPILGFFSILACAWVGSIFADVLLVKGLRLGPRRIEFKRAHLYDINPVGAGAMTAATCTGALAISGLLGAYAHAFAPFVALATACVTVPCIAAATRGRFYIARNPRLHWQHLAQVDCGVCGNAFEPSDIAYCPAYMAPICSLCCTVDSRCHDSCKPHARYGAQLTGLVRMVLPERLRRRVDPLLLRFLGVFCLAGLTFGLILAAIYWQAAGMAPGPAAAHLLATTMWRAFVCLLLIAGVLAWLQVLARESSKTAEDESAKQTQLLLAEIAAHRITDAKLARAREVAEAANLAKTRFVAGVSHELRTPLNAVLGYAQLLELDPSIPAHRREAIRIIRRSGEHLHALIEGLMDISTIEAGRIEIARREVRLPEFLDQIVDMFRLQAAAKSLDFIYTPLPNLPGTVFTDDTRFRQILINLLSNALKFTDVGHIKFVVRMPGAVMEFEVSDTGPGIAEQNLTRIFEPFERIAPLGSIAAQGIGLGLTITKLMVQILGGQISVKSTPGQGSSFLVRLRLPTASQPSLPAPRQAPLIGYEGRRRIILAAEDNMLHRALLEDALRPIGFTLLMAPDGSSCLRLAEEHDVDLFLLDISMPQADQPEIDGLEVARRLRAGKHKAVPIIILSAHVPELRPSQMLLAPADAMLAKPMDIGKLHATIGHLLGLVWQTGLQAPHIATELDDISAAESDAFRPHIQQLRYLAQIGFVRGLKETLVRLGNDNPAATELSLALQGMVEALRLPDFLRMLDEIDAYAG